MAHVRLYFIEVAERDVNGQILRWVDTGAGPYDEGEARDIVAQFPHPENYRVTERVSRTVVAWVRFEAETFSEGDEGILVEAVEDCLDNGSIQEVIGEGHNVDFTSSLVDLSPEAIERVVLARGA